MRLMRWFSSETESGKKIILVLGPAILAFLLLSFGTIACTSESEEEAVEAEEGEAVTAIKEGLNDFEGEVKVAEGRFLFIPNIKGFDIVVTGELQSGDIDSLEGKMIRGQGTVSFDMPSIMIANKIEVQENGGPWQVVYEVQGEQEFSEYLNLEARDEYKVLEDIQYNKSESWEEQEKVRVYGTLEQGEESVKISVYDEEGNKEGEVLVDNMSDYARFYVEKLRLFDKFWFYCDVKETVPWSARRRTRELFHADVVFAGLF